MCWGALPSLPNISNSFLQWLSLQEALNSILPSLLIAECWQQWNAEHLPKEQINKLTSMWGMSSDLLTGWDQLRDQQKYTGASTPHFASLWKAGGKSSGKSGREERRQEGKKEVRKEGRQAGGQGGRQEGRLCCGFHHSRLANNSSCTSWKAHRS